MKLTDLQEKVHKQIAHHNLVVKLNFDLVETKRSKMVLLELHQMSEAIGNLMHFGFSLNEK